LKARTAGWRFDAAEAAWPGFGWKCAIPHAIAEAFPESVRIVFRKQISSRAGCPSSGFAKLVYIGHIQIEGFSRAKA